MTAEVIQPGVDAATAADIAGRNRAGRPAGVVTRGAAYLADVALVTLLYSAGVAGAVFVLATVTGGVVEPEELPFIAVTIGWFLWWVIYFGASTARFGATPAKALFGLRVVRPDGRRVGVLRAGIRAFAVPLTLSFTVGVDALVAAVSSRRRALHDRLCGTVVVYDWPRTVQARRIQVVDVVE
ncbi:MAG: RDD family protein [Acidimicrobiia bacterium]|nr:RDD family protein [Acidimicrobiia bacterium]